MTHARTQDDSAKDEPNRPRRRGLLAGLGIGAAVAVSIAVIASMFTGTSNEGFGAELHPEALRDSLPAELAEGWNAEMCFLLMDNPRGLGAPDDGVPAEVPAVNCLLDDGSPNGISTTMVTDEGFADAVQDPAGGVDMIELGTSPDGAHEVHWLQETGLIYDVTENSVLRFGPYGSEDDARDFASAHGLL
ncbi:hypothetical protein QP932_02055 [Corynebacterium freneyi]|uniref:hypothetical protein n=1 Tax=Corynebacterium freneyi TaxID=134034 RepID=UPI00254D5A5E|nr:hypothetical protein [Corynebacterium freneyi]MDK8767289.1 hypothetical protein [Corynebacterium freneyi]